jgi:hypothetical protein
LFFTYTFTKNYESKHIPVHVRELALELFKGRRRQNLCHPTIHRLSFLSSIYKPLKNLSTFLLLPKLLQFEQAC